MKTPLLSLLLLSLGCLLPVRSRGAAPDNWPIITRRGDELLEGGKPFRFLGLAAPNIQQNESQLRPDFANRFPDEFELRDLLSGLQRVGSRATRSFSLSIFHPADKGVPVYVPARRTYNEEAFRCLDRLLALCPEYDVRVIIPVIASQSFDTIRGVDEFARLSGKEGAAFWTDPEVKADFKHLLDFLLNRRNTITGRLYKEDPAILAWQLGNEFGSYAPDRRLDTRTWEPIIQAWSAEMAAYLKQKDPLHLVMEAGGAPREAFLADPNIDVISEHFYEYWNRLAGRPTELAPLARQLREQCRGRKPLMIDEFGLGSLENMRSLMRTIREDGIVGGLLWSIRSHRRDGGWYYHNEGGTTVNSFHVPGFVTGKAYDEIPLLELLRQEAYAIRGLSVPPVQPPSPAPVLLPLGEGLSWRGSAGASSYVLERAANPEGPWELVAADLIDSVIIDVKAYERTFELPSRPGDVLYRLPAAQPGALVHYRLKAVNEAGASPYSPVLAITSPRP